MESKCNVVIFESYPLFSSGIKTILNASNSIRVAGEASNIDHLLQLVLKTNPNAIVFDILHCINAGLKPLRKIARKFPHIPILLIVGEEYADCFDSYFQLGVKGFIFKDDTSAELIQAIKEVCSGRDHFRDQVRTFFKESLKRNRRGKTSKQPDQSLSDREISVLKLFCRGLTYKEIGNKLCISPRTVETHKQNILSKLKMKSTVDMVKYAFHHQILN
ncbi:LuxR C-terminal-related transcriptional regulator [Sunxiuqinia sp. sy24]|uniref:LuxR C-terminal-related transcriptional regulator n=1 Tax=Sunxiuqinia sp. sy24 TaxID=3461495 RepID=UPI004045B957